MTLLLPPLCWNHRLVTPLLMAHAVLGTKSRALFGLGKLSTRWATHHWLLFIFIFWVWVSLCGPGYPWPSSNLPASVSRVQKLHVWVTTLGLHVDIWITVKCLQLLRHKEFCSFFCWQAMVQTSYKKQKCTSFLERSVILREAMEEWSLAPPSVQVTRMGPLTLAG